MIQTWFKIFFRNSKNNWLNITINILGLTLGFAGLLLVLLYLKDEESYNINNPDKDKIFRVIHKMSNGDVWSSSTEPEGPQYVEEIPEITNFYLSNSWYDDNVAKFDGKEVYTENILEGTSQFFDFFPFEITQGSIKKFTEAKNHVALSEKQAKIYFGEVSPIGKTIEFLNRNFFVTTVFKRKGKHYFMPDVVVQFERELNNHWGSFSDNLFIKTNKNVTVNALNEKANEVFYNKGTLPFAENHGVTPEEFFEKYGTTAIFEKLMDIRLKTITNDAGPEGEGNYQLIIIMLSLSILLIIISSVNFINLSVASTIQRAKEVGVKKTLGLSKTTLARQYTLEIVLQGFIAFVISLVLVELILGSFNKFMKKEISIFEIDVLLKVGLISLGLSFLLGIIPAVYLSKFKSTKVLKGNISRSKKGIFARNLMLGLQFLISGFFLVGSLVIYQQVNYMMSKDLGFNGNQVVMVPINGGNGQDKYKKYLLAKQELTKHPNIEAVTSNSFIIGGGSSNSTNFQTVDATVQANTNAIDYNYLDIMGIKIIKGRGFKEEIASDTTKSVLINETFARALNIYDNPIGQKLSSGFSSDDNDGKNLEVVGMIKDYHIRSLDRKIPPTLIMHWNSFDWMKSNFWMVQFKIKSDNIEETLSDIETYWKDNVEQGYPFSSSFVNKRFAETYTKYKKQKTLFFILTTLVVLVSLLGLFALATLSIQQRLKEVAIRKTLGGSVKEIIYELIKSFLKITIISSIILIPVAYYFIQSWLNNFVYRIEMPVLPYIITPVILIVLVFSVVGLKAYNATKIDLIKYLKFE